MAADRDEPVSSDELIRRARETQESGSNSLPIGEAAGESSQGSESTKPTAHADAESHDPEAVVAGMALNDIAVVPAAPPPTPIEPPEPVWKRAWRWGRWVVLGVVVVNVIAALLSSGQPVESLEIGDCFMLEDVEAITDVDTVDCSESHDLELYARVEITGFGETFPGDEPLVAWLGEQCAPRFEAYVGFDYWTSAYWSFTLTPDNEVWESGDHLGLCAVYLGDTDGNVTRSTRSARNSGI